MTRQIGVTLIFILFCNSALAQTFSKDRLKDWEFRFYACKHVVINAAIVIRLMAKHQIVGQSAIEEMQSQLGLSLVNNVTKHEKEYQFTKSEAWFVSDLTFAVVSGLVQGGTELSETQLFQSGSDICIHTIESMVQ